MTSVCVLGLGHMGLAMARRIREAGFPTTVWNRSTEKAAPLAALGVTVAETPDRAVADADVVLTMLFDADAVRQVMSRAVTQMRAGAIWMQSATVGIAAQTEFAELAERAGVRFVDAPMVGTKAPAEAGTLIALVAGSDDAVRTLGPVLAAISSRFVRAGEAAPAASALKLAVNSWVATLTAGTAQALGIASQLGLDPRLVFETVAGSASDSPYLHQKGEAMLAGTYTPQFEVVGLLKDIRLAREVTPGLAQDLLAALDALYTRTAETAPHEDISAVWKTLRQA